MINIYCESQLEKFRSLDFKYLIVEVLVVEEVVVAIAAAFDIVSVRMTWSTKLRKRCPLLCDQWSSPRGGPSSF